MKTDSKQLYQSILLDHANRPPVKPPLSLPNKEIILNNNSCGDTVKCSVWIDGQTVNTVSCQVDGCVLCKASASIMQQLISKNDFDQINLYIKSITKLIKTGKLDPLLNKTDAVSLLNTHQYPSRYSCVLLPWNALRKLLL